MRLRLLTQILAGIIVAYSTTASFAQPCYAQSTTFYCGRNKGIPVTYARTRNGKRVPMIRWISNKFRRPWTRERRCQVVSRRFQRNFDNGRLRYIVSGKLRGYPVLCAAKRKNSRCTSKSLLLTLPRGSNAQAKVQVLLNRRGLASGNVLNESAGKTNFDPNNVDFGEFLNNAKSEPEVNYAL